MRRLLLLPLLLLLLPLRAAAQDHEDAVHLAPEVLEEFGLRLETAGPRRLARPVTLAGQIRPDADHLARIAPRFAGILTEVGVRIGDRVEEGQVLARIESDESLSEYEVRTLIPGTVIGRDAVLGEAAERDHVLFTVADLSRVWLDLTVHQRDLPLLREGQEVSVVQGHDEVVDRGRISYLAPVLDEGTRTAVARVVLENPAGRWRPGMFVTGVVHAGGWETGVAVESSALIDLEGRSVVFVREGEDFHPRSVRTGRRGVEAVEILEGLSAGETYVADGAFVLKAELGKTSFGDGHGH